MTAQSVITAKAQLALLHAELAERLTRARRDLLALVPTAVDLTEEQRLAKKAAGVRFVQQYHLAPVLAFEGPSEVLAYVREAEENIHAGGYEAAFVQGVDLAFGYIRDYLR